MKQTWASTLIDFHKKNFVYVIPIIVEGTMAKYTSCKENYCLDKRLRILKYLKRAQCLVSRLLKATFSQAALPTSCDHASNPTVHSPNDIFSTEMVIYV